MAIRPGMARGVAPRRLVAAADVPAVQASAQMKPAAAGGQALLAAPPAGGDGMDAVEVAADRLRAHAAMVTVRSSAPRRTVSGSGASAASEPIASNRSSALA